MKGTTGLLLTAVACALLSGCASTSESSAPAAYPTLKVLSDTPYVWDDSISEALNVARMAQPAGVGNGMRDFADGKLATTGRIGGGTRAIDAGLGLLSQGLFGVVSMEALNAGVNRQLDWKPSVVLTVAPSQISDNSKIDYVKTRDVVSKQIIDSLKMSVPDFQLIGVFTSKYHDETGDAVIAFRTSKCEDSEKFDSFEGKYDGPKSLGVVNGFLEGPVDLTNFCAVVFKTSVAGTLAHTNDFIVVAELFGTSPGSSYFDPLIAKHLDGYFLYPDYYEYQTRDRLGVNKAVALPYAKVIKSGKEILFSK
jgi:hypothetical protein